VPTPARTSIDAIVIAGRDILEAEGLDGLTMQRVASAVGIRAPSLYKRVRDRRDLVRLIVEDVSREFARILDGAAVTGSPQRDLRALAMAFRAYAHEHPEAYALLFARLPEGARPDAELTARGTETILRTARSLAGPERALEAARTVVAWAHGFVSMELAGAFRLGGDIDRAFAFGVDRLTISITAPPTGSEVRPPSHGG
jgi:AcrR family transcriptional regulator